MIKRPFKKAALMVGAAVLTAGLISTAKAAEWPTKPITMLIGYSAGGGTTTKGRVLAAALSKELGQKINVLNRPGGGQSLALTLLANEKPNGDMFFFGSLSGLSMMPQLNSAVTYDLNSFVYAGGITTFQPTLVVPMGAPYNTIEEFVAWAKKADRVKFASLSPMSKMIMQTIAAEAKLTNIDYVPTKGGAGVNRLLLSEQVDVAYSGGSYAKHLDMIKGIAAITSKRHKTAPQMPTLNERGYAIKLDTPTLIAFPKGTSPAIIKKMEAALKVVQSDPDLIKITTALLTPIDYRTAAEAKTVAETVWNNFATVIKSTGFTPK
jgi:tripartite-type tricarboxylate transporter receptor subunit TctC